jgi:hypothetical protein
LNYIQLEYAIREDEGTQYGMELNDLNQVLVYADHNLFGGKNIYSMLPKKVAAPVY